MVKREKQHCRKPFEGLTLPENQEKNQSLRNRINELNEKIGNLKRRKKEK